MELNNTEIKQVSKTKSLGFIVDEHLTWDEQFQCTKGKAYSGLSALKVLKNIIPQSQLCNVYLALIKSHLRYSDVIWRIRSLSNIKTDTLAK